VSVLKWATVPVADLRPEERAWIEANEAMWRQAHEIAARNPGLDPGDLYPVRATPARDAYGANLSCTRPWPPTLSRDLSARGSQR